MILMIEFNGETEAEVREKIKALHRKLSGYRARYEINGFEEDPTEGASEKFWTMRRNAFNLGLQVARPLFHPGLQLILNALQLPIAMMDLREQRSATGAQSR